MLRPYSSPFKKRHQQSSLTLPGPSQLNNFGASPRRSFRRVIRSLLFVCALFLVTSDVIFAPLERLFARGRNLCAYFLGDLNLDSFWEEAFPALASYLPTDVTALPPGDVGFVITLSSCPEDTAQVSGKTQYTDPGDAFYDAAAVLKHSIENNLNATGKYTATLHAIVHPEAIFCTSPITGDQYDRVRVLESLGYHVIIKGSPIIGPSGEMVNISDPYVAENVNNDVGERDLITIYASEIQNETALVLTDLNTAYIEPLDPVLDDFINNANAEVAFSVVPPTQQEPVIITVPPTTSPSPTLPPVTSVPSLPPVTENPTKAPVTPAPTLPGATYSPSESHSPSISQVPTFHPTTPAPTKATPAPTPAIIYTASPTRTQAPTRKPTQALIPLSESPVVNDVAMGGAVIDMNTMVMMKPAPELTQKLYDLYTNLTYDPVLGWDNTGIGNFTGSLGTAGILSYYYSHIKPLAAAVLDECQYGQGLSERCGSNPTETKVVNLAKCGAPWTCPDYSGMTDSQRRLCESYEKFWFQSRKNFEESCLINAPGSVSSGSFYSYVTLGYCNEKGEKGYNKVISDAVCNRNVKRTTTSRVLVYSKNGKTKVQTQSLSIEVGESTRRAQSCVSANLTRPAIEYNVALVIDTSASSCNSCTGGATYPDYNNDGKTNTLLDAQISASINLLESICATDGLGNGKVKVGLISFGSTATYHGQYDPCNPSATRTVSSTVRTTLLGLICGGDSNYGDALSKAYTFFEAAPFTNRMNRMFFLSDGKPSLTGVTEVQQGISWKNPSRASDYATQRQNLDFYEVERVAVGVCGGADLRAGFDMDIIDNTGNGPSSDISNDCKIRNPIVGSILDLEVWINGKKDQTITKDSLTENSLGYHLPETAVEGFDPTDGVVNQVEVKCRIDADGDTSTTEDMMTMSSGETVTGKLVTGVGSTTSCEVACCDGTKACNEEDCPKFTEYGSIDVCFALDESGSVCSSSSPNLCSGSGRSSVCDYNGKYDKKDPQFCPKFNTNTKDFVKGFIRELDKVAGPKSVSTRYSVITFSSNADNDQALSDSATTINTINNLQYEGGYTRTAEAMKQCQDYLQKGNPMADKLIVLVTDGRPRYDGSDPASYRVTLVPSYAANIKAGKEADNASRSAPIMKIMAIGVRTVESNLDFVEDLASPGMSFKLADGYENLSDKIALVAKEALQSSCGGIVIPR